jgi:hypothetical protein
VTGSFAVETGAEADVETFDFRKGGFKRHQATAVTNTSRTAAFRKTVFFFICRPPKEGFSSV